MSARHSGCGIAAAFAFAALLAPGAFAACHDCGTVTDVKHDQEGRRGERARGAVIGGVAGGVLGHQVGSGRGNDVATVAGAAGGAYAGHQVEKNKNATTTYEVVVKMENGAHAHLPLRQAHQLPGRRPREDRRREARSPASGRRP